MPAEQLLPVPGKGAGVLSTAMAVACQMAGVGILQLPLMLAQSGWACLGLIVVCALGTNFTGKLLVRCCYEGPLRARSSYAEIGHAAFGWAGRSVALFFERMTLLGVSTLFLILAGKFVFELAPSSWAATSKDYSLVCAGLAGLVVVCFRTVAELKAVTYLGVAAVVAVCGAVIVTANLDDPLPGRSGPTSAFQPSGLVPAFSALALSLAAHAGLPSIEAAMREPSKFGKSLDLAYGFVLCLYLPIAAVGYGVFGDKVYSPVLCSLPRHGWVQEAAKLLVTLHVVLTYPVLMTLCASEMEASVQLQDSRMYLLKRTVFRLLLVGGTALVAVFCPYFPDMMGLVGALCVVMTAYVLPCVFYVKLVASPRQRWLPLLVALVGVAAGSLGVVQAATQLYGKISSGADPNA